MSEFTTIRISKQTVEQLKQILSKSETYDQGLSKLIKEWGGCN